MNKTDFNTGWMYGHAGEEKHPVTLPHDAMLYDGRGAEEPTGSAGAFFGAGSYEYEKEFEVPQDAAERKQIGRRRVKNCRAVFRTSYAPGGLRAVAYDASGKKIGEDVLRSASNALHLDARIIKEPVSDVLSLETIYVELSVCDENGITEMNRNITLRASVSGAELLGFGSANPRTEEDFTAGIYTTYCGRALAVVRKEKGVPAQILIEEADGEDPAFRCSLKME